MVLGTTKWLCVYVKGSAKWYMWSGRHRQKTRRGFKQVRLNHKQGALRISPQAQQVRTSNRPWVNQSDVAIVIRNAPFAWNTVTGLTSLLATSPLMKFVQARAPQQLRTYVDSASLRRWQSTTVLMDSILIVQNCFDVLCYAMYHLVVLPIWYGMAASIQATITFVVHCKLGMKSHT